MPNDLAAPDVEGLIRMLETGRIGKITPMDAELHAAAALRAQRAEIERLSQALGVARADMMGMRDGALVRDQAAEIERLRAELSTGRIPAPPAPNTIRVRIALAVGADGHWAGAGARGDGDMNDMTWAREIFSRNLESRVLPHVVFITADAPLPKAPKEIMGRMET